jgi:hypothetical protein
MGTPARDPLMTGSGRGAVLHGHNQPPPQLKPPGPSPGSILCRSLTKQHEAPATIAVSAGGSGSTTLLLWAPVASGACFPGPPGGTTQGSGEGGRWWEGTAAGKKAGGGSAGVATLGWGCLHI